MEQEKNKYKTKSVLFYDHGTFFPLAERLAQDFGDVKYFSSWKSSFPTSVSTLVGYGIEGVERVNDFFDYVDEADLIVFPDCGDGDLQEYLRSKGKRVFGSGHGEEMELRRAWFKEKMRKMGLDVGKYEVIKGMDNLRNYLKKHENVWVKCEIYRGDFETLNSINYKMIEPVLDELEYKFGARKKIAEFIVEDNLGNCVESGMDLYSADGAYPNKILAGIEIKDQCYAAVAKDYNEFPKSLTGFTDKIVPLLKAYKFRSFFSTEQRISKTKSYQNDFCARLGSPPSELYQVMYENLSDIIWNVSDGIMVNPIIKHKFGAEVLIHSTWADKNWQPLQIPEKIRPFVKIRNKCIIDKEIYAVPRNGGMVEIGAVVATGDTLDEAIEKVKEYAEQVEGYYIDVNCSCIDSALEESKKLEEYGIKLF